MPLMTDEQDQDSPTFGGSLPDDLFNDPNSALPQPENPLADATAARKIDELSLSSACQYSRKISWANNGSIAEIAKDGRNINIRTLLRNGTRNHLELSEPVKLELPQISFGFPFTHVSWSPAHNVPVLVAAGFTGNLALYGSQSASNDFKPQSLLAFPNNDSDSPCIAIHWLRIVKSAPAPGCIRFASRSGALWSYNPVVEKPLGPFCPLPGNQSFLAVTKTHTLRYCYHGLRASPWTHISIPLDSCSSLEEMLTHASFAPYKENSFLLATLDLSLTLRVYEVTISWNLPAELKNHPPPDFQLQPTVNVNCVKIVESFIPEVPSGSEFGVKAYQLLCLAPTPEATNDSNRQPLIMAAFAAVNQLQTTSAIPTYSTKIVVHCVNDTVETLHESFKEMARQAGKQLGNAQRPTIALAKVTEVEVPGFILSLIPQQADTLVAMLKADGTCDLFDRTTCKIMDTDVTSATLRHPLNTAYIFPADDELSPESCLSPNSCMLACRTDFAVSLKRVEKLSTAPDDRALAALTILSSNACLLGINNDDIFDCLLHLSTLQTPTAICLETFKTLPQNFDFVADEGQPKIQAFLGGTHVQKGLSLLESLHISPRSVPAKAASLMLDLRAFCIVMQVSMNTHPGQIPGADLPASLHGLVTWFTTLIAFLVDDVLDLQRALPANPSSDAIQRLAAQSQTPTLLLLLPSPPRMLLRVASRFLRTFAAPNTRIAALVPPAYHASWARLVRTAAEAPVPLVRFEEFLNGLQYYAKEAYDSAEIAEGERGAIERDFLVTGVIPDVLEGLAKRLVGSSIDRLMDESKVNQMVLFKMDVRPLGITDDEETMRWWRGRRRCTFRKVELAPGVRRWKRCARCGRCTEELGDVKTAPMWLNRMARSCVCGGGWVVVEG